jgi:CheY-like chemotaxis protein
MTSSEARAVGEEAPDAGARVEHVHNARRNAKPLMVEDDMNTRFALSVLLERAGLDVVAVANGAAALQTLKHTHDIDIVLMDIMMPIMAGYETMRAIRDIPISNDLPVIAVTDRAAEGELDRCLAAGASDYIPEPLNTAELMGAIGRWLPASDGQASP